MSATQSKCLPQLHYANFQFSNLGPKRYYICCCLWMKTEGRGLNVDGNCPSCDNMVINTYLRVGWIPFHHKYYYKSKNVFICGVSALVYEYKLHLFHSHHDGSPWQIYSHPVLLVTGECVKAEFKARFKNSVSLVQKFQSSFRKCCYTHRPYH